MELTTLLALAVVFLAILYALQLRASWQASVTPVKPATFQVGDLTSETLRYYCGYDYMKPILIAVRSKLYDVTKSSRLYGPGKEMHVYAGKEISRALAKGSQAEEDMNANLKDLTEEEQKRLEEKIAELDAEYDIVGQVVPMKDLTIDELAQYDGSHDPSLPLYLSIKGKVYNVSKGSTFYGPEGAYPFAGRECARALALMSTELSDCTDNTDDLSYPEKEALKDWQDRFNAKYPVVGRIVSSSK